jgi:hypothetical protein
MVEYNPYPGTGGYESAAPPIAGRWVHVRVDLSTMPARLALDVDAVHVELGDRVLPPTLPPITGVTLGMRAEEFVDAGASSHFDNFVCDPM